MPAAARVPIQAPSEGDAVEMGETDEVVSCELWEKGSKVDALDVAGTWYVAKVVDERGQGEAREYLVHYNGWKARYDEWVGAGSGRVRAAGSGELGPCKRLAAATKMETGSRVEALDPRGTWYAAAVVDERGTGLSRELLVHYNGWNKRQDEWMGVCSGRLRAPGGKLDPSKSVASHEEGDGQHRSASAPKVCAGDAVTAATRAPSAPAPGAIDPTHSQTQEPPACLADQWLGVPTEHFGTLSLGLMRYLGKVAREEDDQVFFWLVIDGNEHCAPRATVREWLLPVGEVANAVKGMLRTSPPKQTCAPVSVPAPAAVARTAAATAPRPALAPAAAVTAIPPSGGPPKQLKRPAEVLDSADDLVGRWVGVPTEHFQVESGGGRYLGQVTSRRGKTSVWYKCEGREYHDQYTKVREWVISDKEVKFAQAHGGKLGPSADSAGTVITSIKTLSRVPAGVGAAPTQAAAPTAAPKQLKRPAEVLDSADDLVGRWVGVPTEHFQVESGGGRYLGQVTSRRGKTSVWYKCEGREYHDQYTKVREWVISDKERTAVEWYKDPKHGDGDEKVAHTQEPRDITRSRADEQAKRARLNTVRARASTPAAAARKEDFGADFDGGVDLDEAQPILAHGRQRKAAGRQSKAEALKDGWKGKPISKGAGGELFYTQLCVKGENFHVGDTVFVQGSSEPHRPWLCRIDSFWESTSGERFFEGRWYWYPDETCAGRLQGHDTREIFQTEHCTDQQEVEVIDSQCHVLSWDVYQEWLDQPSTGCDDDHTYICRASYHPGTGEFRPLVGASSLAEAVRVSVGGGYAESESSQAEVPAPALQRKARLSRFAQAAERLTPSAAPERTPGREKELEEVTCSLRGAICEGGLGASLYLSGTPGTGKTATVHQALRQLASEKDLPAFRTVEMNGMKLSSPYQVHSRPPTGPSGLQTFRSRASLTLAGVQSAVGGPDGPGGCACTCCSATREAFWRGDHARHPGAAQLRRTPRVGARRARLSRHAKAVSHLQFVRMGDQRQLSAHRRCDFQHHGFARAGASTCPKPGACILHLKKLTTLCAVSPQLLPRVHSRLGIRRVNFHPYGMHEIATILNDRLGKLEVFHGDGVELAGRKVASVSGDIRRALEICRLAAQIADVEQVEAARGERCSSGKVTFEHIDAAAKQLRGSPKLEAMMAAPRQEQLLLVAAVLLQASSGRAEVEAAALAQRHQALCKKFCEFAPTEAEHRELVARMCCSRMLAPATAHGALRLMVQPDDVKHITRTVPELAPLFPA